MYVHTEEIKRDREGECFYKKYTADGPLNEESAVAKKR
jgi:hypothetical protein